MKYLTFKNQINLVSSRKRKKSSFYKHFIKSVNSSMFSLSLRYNFLFYFSKKNKINLNKSILYKIVTEERGSSLVLQNWLCNFFSKKY